MPAAVAPAPHWTLPPPAVAPARRSDSMCTQTGSELNYQNHCDPDHQGHDQSGASEHEINPGLPPLDDLVATMDTMRKTAAAYTRQAIMARLPFGGRQRREERAAQLEAIQNAAAGAGALGLFAVSTGTSGAPGGEGVRTRMRLKGSAKEVEVLNAASLSYLGLEREPEVLQAVKDALNLHGTSVTNSRAICGSGPLHLELEAELAGFLRKEAAVLFPSGWTACMAAVRALARKGDAVFMDDAAHDCLRTGARVARADIIKFKSANAADLERALKRHRSKYTNAIIVTEAIFSVDGAVLPEAEFAALAKSHDCLLLVDVSHSLGLWGASGEGLLDTCHADVICGTLSKSLVTSGGFVAGTRPMMSLTAVNGLVTTANVSNTNAAAALAALRLIRREPQRVHALQAKIMYARHELAQRAGVDLKGQGGAVIHLPCGEHSDGDAAVAWRLLWEQGVYCQLMCYPAVALGCAGPRFAITSKMSTADIDQLVAAMCVTLSALSLVQEAYCRSRHAAVVAARGTGVVGAVARLAAKGNSLSHLLSCLRMHR